MQQRRSELEGFRCAGKVRTDVEEEGAIVQRSEAPYNSDAETMSRETFEITANNSV
jgi:hypothetical protein